MLGWNSLDMLSQDVRYGLRQLRRSPGFTIAAVLTLALGIGANTAVFSVINAVLLRPLPYPDADHILFLYSGALTTGNFEDWRSQSKSYDKFAAVAIGGAQLTGVPEPENLKSLAVSADFFPLLGIRPALGRPFQLDDFQPRSPRVVIVSDGLWRRSLKASQSAIGKTVILGGALYTVVGVMPPDPGPFPYHDNDLWLPLIPSPSSDSYTSAIGHLKPGMTYETARAEGQTISARLAGEGAKREVYRPLIQVVRLKDQLVEESRLTLLLLAGAVGFILMIACANVANLLLVRVAGREREIAVRTALGAGRSRVVRQLLTEGFLLSGLSAAVGLVAARWVTDILIFRIPYHIPRIGQSRIDGLVVIFVLLSAIITCLFFSTAPALATRKVDINQALKEGARSETSTGSPGRLRSALVVLEVSLAMILLTGAGLLIKAFFVLRPSDPGFDATNKLTMTVRMPPGRYNVAAQQIALLRQMSERIESLSHVRGVAAISDLKMSETSMLTAPDISIEGKVVASPDHGQFVFYFACTPNYLRLMRMPVLIGRDFTGSDNETAPKVAIVNESLGRRLWPRTSAVGQRFTINLHGQPVEFTVVGVVRDARIFGTSTKPRPEIYVSIWQNPYSRLSLVVHTSGDPKPRVVDVRDVLHSLDRDLVVSDIQTIDQLLYDSVASPRFDARLFGILAALALVLTLVGIYGVVSYAISQRTREFGVRIALGAESGDILQLVLKRGVVTVLAGVVIGLAGAFSLTRFLQSLLFEVSPLDPTTYVGVTAMLVAVSLLACYIPARRATKVDPMVALRYE
jgi:predicted permease